MSIKSSLSLIFFSTFLFLIIFLIFFFLIDPVEGGLFASAILFISLFFSLLGIFTLIFIVLKLRVLKDTEKIFEKFTSAFRQTIFISLFIISILLLKYFKLLEWWSAAVTFLFFLLLELLFSTKKRKFTYNL